MIGLVLVVLAGGLLLAWALDREARRFEPPRLKPTPWPEMCWPTPEEWLGWLLSHRHDARLVIAERALDSAQRAAACLVMDHEAAMYQVTTGRATQPDTFTSTGARR